MVKKTWEAALPLLPFPSLLYTSHVVEGELLLTSFKQLVNSKWILGIYGSL